jgi:hypothetical protein
MAWHISRDPALLAALLLIFTDTNVHVEFATEAGGRVSAFRERSLIESES